MEKQTKASSQFRAVLAPISGVLAAAAVIGLINAQYFTAQISLMMQPEVPPAAVQAATTVKPEVEKEPEPTPAKVSQEPKVIIPQAAIDAPVVYGMGSVDDRDVQRALQDGVLHFANTPLPGESGNSVFVGHSSNAPWVPGQYKFVFAPLDQLEVDDVFYLHYEGFRYEYKVTSKTVVMPHEVSVLAPTEKPSATLITCTPVGTNLKRLVIRGELQSPMRPNAETQQNPAETNIQALPGNS